MNMEAELQSDRSGEVFSKQLLNIGNSKIPVDTSSGYMTFLVTLLNQRQNSSKWCSQTLLKITKIMFR